MYLLLRSIAEQNRDVTNVFLHISVFHQLHVTNCDVTRELKVDPLRRAIGVSVVPFKVRIVCKKDVVVHHCAVAIVDGS